MNYKKVYKSLIKKRQDNPLFKIVNGDYVENHHIKPQSFFPNNTPQKVMDKDNTVYLTGREHFVAHCLLAKIYKTGSRKWHKMNKAINRMNCKSDYHKDRYVNSRLYEHLKTKYYKQINKENEQKCLIELNKICDWMDKNGRKPTRSSKIAIEIKMGNKIDTMRKAKKNKGSAIFYKSYQELVDARGYARLFDNVNNEVKNLQAIEKICTIIDNNSRKPSGSSKNPIEKNLGNKLRSFKKGKDGKFHGIKFLQSYQELATQLDYPSLFENEDLEKIGLEQINKICDWMLEHDNKTPSSCSKDKIEKSIGNKLSGLRMCKKGKGDGRFYNSYQNLVETRGYPTLFENIYNINKNL